MFLSSLFFFVMQKMYEGLDNTTCWEELLRAQSPAPPRPQCSKRWRRHTWVIEIRPSAASLAIREAQDWFTSWRNELRSNSEGALTDAAERKTRSQHPLGHSIILHELDPVECPTRPLTCISTPYTLSAYTMHYYNAFSALKAHFKRKPNMASP